MNSTDRRKKEMYKVRERVVRRGNKTLGKEKRKLKGTRKAGREKDKKNRRKVKRKDRREGVRE